MKDVLYIKKIIMSYSKEALETFKKYSKNYLTYYCVDVDVMPREVICEKMFEYINTYKIKNEVKDSELINIMCNLIDNRLDDITVKGSRASKYCAQCVKLSQKIRDNPDLEDIKSYIRLFVSLSSESIKWNKKIEEVSLDISLNKYDMLVNDMKDEKKGKEVLFIHQKNRYNFKNKYSKTNITMLLVIMYYIGIMDQFN